MRLADEVEHGEDTLALCPAETPPKLLQEDRRAFGRTQEKDRVDLWDVYAFVEDVDSEDCPELITTKASDGTEARFRVGVAV